MTAACDLVVVGASWGGMSAVGELLRHLDPEIGLALAIALHRRTDSPDRVLAGYFQSRSPLPVVEAHDKEEITAGRVYLAPADYHLLVEPGRFALSTDAPVQYSRPSIDVLFESAADAYAERATGVILTGANEDGAAGVRRIRRFGGRTIAQDPATAERPEMPAAAVATGMVDEILALKDIAVAVNRLGKG